MNKQTEVKTAAEIKHYAIEKEFQNWLEKVFGNQASKNQVIEMRKAFFCGGFVVLNKICDFSELSTEIAETKFDNVLAELQTRIEGWAKDGTT